MNYEDIVSAFDKSLNILSSPIHFETDNETIISKISVYRISDAVRFNTVYKNNNNYVNAFECYIHNTTNEFIIEGMAYPNLNNVGLMSPIIAEHYTDNIPVIVGEDNSIGWYKVGNDTQIYYHFGYKLQKDMPKDILLKHIGSMLTRACISSSMPYYAPWKI